MKSIPTQKGRNFSKILEIAMIIKDFKIKKKFSLRRKCIKNLSEKCCFPNLSRSENKKDLPLFEGFTYNFQFFSKLHIVLVLLI